MKFVYGGMWYPRSVIWVPSRARALHHFLSLFVCAVNISAEWCCEYSTIPRHSNDTWAMIRQKLSTSGWENSRRSILLIIGRESNDKPLETSLRKCEKRLKWFYVRIPLSGKSPGLDGSSRTENFLINFLICLNTRTFFHFLRLGLVHWKGSFFEQACVGGLCYFNEIVRQISGS